MRIRRGTPADRAGAVEVWRAAQAARGQRPPAARVARVEEKVANALLVVADDERDMVLAMALGEPGQDGKGIEIPGVLHVSMVFVHPDHQRQGIGSELLEGLADEAWAQGYRSLSLWSHAPEFYEACGLERTTDVQDGAVRLVAELEAPLREVVVASDGIRLGQLLKLAELVDTGSEGKALLATGGVEVNGEVEVRRGRQMVNGDEVRALDQALRVVVPV